jgi:hypothetical protein
MMNKTFGADDKLMKQMYGEHGDRGVPGVSNTHLDQMLKGANTSRSEFDAMPSPAQEAFLYENGTDEYRSAVDATQGLETPEAAAARKSAEAFGTSEGNQYGSDREAITGVRTKVMQADQSLNGLSAIESMLENPDNEDMTGWPRMIRDFLKTNTAEDGTIDEATANGVVQMISKATFGALSQSELDLLKGGLMDPNKSTEYNLGTLRGAMKRIEDEKQLALSGARQASDRYKKWKGQDDYDSIFEDEWLYNNVGAGSRIKSIPAFGNNDEYSFQDHVSDTMEELGPFDQKPTRDELINSFAKQRREAEELYREMERRRQEAAEAAQQVAPELEQEFPVNQ